jgi:hypothetical protein
LSDFAFHRYNRAKEEIAGELGDLDLRADLVKEAALYRMPSYSGFGYNARVCCSDGRDS